MSTMSQQPSAHYPSGPQYDSREQHDPGEQYDSREQYDFREQYDPREQDGADPRYGAGEQYRAGQQPGQPYGTGQGHEAGQHYGAGQPYTAGGYVHESQAAYPYATSAVPQPYSPQTNTMAILSLVFAFVFSPLGLVFGFVGLSQIKRTGEQGKGLAIAGLIISGLGVLFFVCYIFLMLLVVASGAGA